jgi:NAD(P)-dependent dehydrogenase (short-subunit alcohol dehydrogenase family)
MDSTETIRAAAQAALPPLEGELRVAGLTASVTVHRDAEGIPHIRAENVADAWFAQGFVHAQDRLFQMELNRRRALGRSAEWLGAPAFASDALARRLGVEGASRRDAAGLGADARVMIEAYAAGVNAVIASGAPLHLLVNNAGALIDPRTETSEGLEANFAVNTLTPFILTEELLPLLRASAPSRAIMVSSGGQYTEELVTKDLQWSKEGGFSGARQYARDKRRQTVLTEHWASLAENSGVVFASMHPGWADTDAVRTSLPQFYDSLKPKCAAAAPRRRRRLCHR